MFFYRADPLDKPLIFITGAPRSGTSMITKVIGAHPDTAILMENIFGNRRRHWTKAEFWNSPKTLRSEVKKIFRNLNEPIVGNKVCTPDVWSVDDIMTFGNLFQDFKIVFVVRDPIQVALSRFYREDYEAEFNQAARRNILLDFRSRFFTYSSSWRQSIETFWKLRDGFPEKVYVVYYEDFGRNFDNQVERLCDFLNLPLHDNMLNWHQLPHRDARGELKHNLKYPDRPINVRQYSVEDLTEDIRSMLLKALASVKSHRELWLAREL